MLFTRKRAFIAPLSSRLFNFCRFPVSERCFFSAFFLKFSLSALSASDNCAECRHEPRRSCAHVCVRQLDGWLSLWSSSSGGEREGVESNVLSLLAFAFCSLESKTGQAKCRGAFRATDSPVHLCTRDPDFHSAFCATIGPQLLGTPKKKRSSCYEAVKCSWRPG